MCGGVGPALLGRNIDPFERFWSRSGRRLHNAFEPDEASTLGDCAQHAASEVVGLDGHYLASPYPGLQNPIVLSAWQRQLAVDSLSDPAVAEFVERQLGRVSETAPEAGASCAEAVGAPPFDPDRNYDEAEQFFMDR